ncbi:MAG TPA: ASKHA domain-containing protein [Clostridia bacterium]
MVKVKFVKEERVVEVSEGTTLLEAARIAKVTIEAPCNGVGVCGKCKVRVYDIKSVISGRNVHSLSEKEQTEGYVLACEAKVYDDVRVETQQGYKNEAVKILEHGASFDFELDRHINKIYRQDENKTYIYKDEEIISVENTDTTSECYGVVVDIGTTTLVVSLVDLKNGKELSSVSALNPQAIHAQDVLSRIKLASDKEGLKLMHSELIERINVMIGSIAKDSGVRKENIYEIVLSGNTCMLHLSCNVNPESIGRYPYTPALKGGENVEASGIGLEISKYGLAYLPPIISAYVGADITSGILASQLHNKKGAVLFVDIGTNGEMVLSVDGKLTATSTAAGPAFEGMNITYGMRAGIGAIEFFNINEDKSIDIKVIGNEKAKGICGSGLLDIVGELAANGLLDKNGRLKEPQDESDPLKERFQNIDGKTVFYITDEVFISQKDVRQVQLAKGAVRAGIEFLLKECNIEAKDVEKVLVAGSFGYHLRAKSLINIGLFPVELEERLEFIGNTSKAGGHAFLVNKTYRSEMEKLVSSVDVIELSRYKDFDRVFVNCLGFNIFNIVKT